MKETRVTKRDYFNELKEIVAEREDLVEFLDKQIALLDKKKTGTNDKKAQEVAEKVELVFNAIKELGKAVTVAEIANELGEGWSPQKASAYVKKLKDAGTVVRTKEKRIAYFSIAE